MKRLTLVCAFPLLLSGCQWTRGSRQAVAVASPVDSPAHCIAREVSRERLMVEGNRALYVNPLALVTSLKGDVLLAGTPNALTTLDQSGKAVNFVYDSVFGVLLRPDGTKRIIPSPVEDTRRADAIRAVELRNGKWAFTFIEWDHPIRTDEVADEPTNPTLVVRLWYGVYDGHTWSALEQLPFPAEGRVKPVNASPLVRQGDTLAWAMPIETKDHWQEVVLFERRGGRWKYEIIPVENAAYVTVAHSDTLGFVLAPVYGYADQSQPTDENSLFLYSRRPTWKLLRRVVHGDTEGPVDHPTLSLSPAGGVLSWLTYVPGAVHGRQEGRAMLGYVEERNSRIVTLDSAIAWSFVPVTMRNGMRLWVADHLLSVEKQERETRFVIDSAGVGASVIGRIPNLFLSTFNATSPAPSEVLVTGAPDMNPPMGVIVSLLLRVRVACGANTS